MTVQATPKPLLRERWKCPVCGAVVAVMTSHEPALAETMRAAKKPHNICVYPPKGASS